MRSTILLLLSCSFLSFLAGGYFLGSDTAIPPPKVSYYSDQYDIPKDSQPELNEKLENWAQRRAFAHLIQADEKDSCTRRILLLQEQIKIELRNRGCSKTFRLTLNATDRFALNPIEQLEVNSGDESAFVEKQLKSLALELQSEILALEGASKTKPYYPALVFGETSRRHDMIADWYAATLRSMDQGPIYGTNDTNDEQTYRFLWLRSFHDPITLKLSIFASGDALLTVNVLQNPGIEEWQDKLWVQEIQIEREMVASFLNTLDEINYWNLPSADADKSMQHDGAQWILEGKDGDKYHVVDRWSIGEDEIKMACLKLIEFSGLELSEEEIY